MNKEELLNSFLSAFPNSAHPLDNKRFVAYAVQCAIEHTTIDSESIGEKVSSERLKVLESAYSWIRQSVDYIQENKEVLELIDSDAQGEI